MVLSTLSALSEVIDSTALLFMSFINEDLILIYDVSPLTNRSSNRLISFKSSLVISTTTTSPLGLLVSPPVSS